MGGRGGQGQEPGAARQRRLRDRLQRQISNLPESVQVALKDRGVSLRVISEDEASRLIGEAATSTRGFYLQGTAYVIEERFQGRRGIKNARMTALHEIAHGVDESRGITSDLRFLEAVRTDRRNLRSLRLTSKQEDALTYQHYRKSTRRRIEEVFAEGFAILHGPGRPKPAREWVDTSLFKKAWPNALRAIEELTR